MKQRWGWIAGVAAVAIVPTLGVGQGTPAKPPPPKSAGPTAERVLVAEVREGRCRDGTRTVSVKMPDAGEQPVEVRLVDSQGFVSTYVLLPQPKKPVAADQGCTVRERGPVFPWY